MVNIFDTISSFSAAGSASIFNVQHDAATTRLNKQMSNDFNKRIEEEVTRINDSYSIERNSVLREGDLLKKYREELTDSLDVISNTKTRLEGVLSSLDNMIINVNKATESENDPDVNFMAHGYAAAHDSYYRRIEDLINNTRTTNLLVSDTTSVRYPLNENGVSALIYGSDIKTNYYLTDQNDETWYPEQSGQLLRVYESYPFEEGTEVASMKYDQGLQLDSYTAPDTVAFTTAANTASPQNYTATITREGIGITNAWLYGGLADSSNRERALEDINAAKEAINVELSKYDMHEATLNFYYERAKNDINGNRKERISIEAEAARAVAEKQSKMFQQFQAVQSSLAQALVVKNEYQNLIPTGNSLAQSLFNLNV
ncbi:hypothetical protein [Terasakiella sp. SH-1]|uniref:hypothetical protein n=1 Tax=Terasakiella sp. SH-1 TaxID=2560057 RepID=UPI001072F42F|nr:hypothetical protein [Terasakiella sp. SH-1]